jgi:hypothetical protein
MLARGLKYLETVEWTVWFREEGHGEERKKICIDRSAGQGQTVASIPTGKAESSMAVKTTAKPPTNRNRRDMQNNKKSEGEEEDVLSNEGTLSEFICRTSKVPLALYPAVLG